MGQASHTTVRLLLLEVRKVGLQKRSKCTIKWLFEESKGSECVRVCRESWKSPVEITRKGTGKSIFLCSLLLVISITTDPVTVRTPYATSRVPQALTSSQAVLSTVVQASTVVGALQPLRTMRAGVRAARVLTACTKSSLRVMI